MESAEAAVYLARGATRYRVRRRQRYFRTSVTLIGTTNVTGEPLTGTPLYDVETSTTALSIFVAGEQRLVGEKERIHDELATRARLTIGRVGRATRCPLSSDEMYTAGDVGPAFDGGRLLQIGT